jgi:hypothetical protein
MTTLSDDLGTEGWRLVGAARANRPFESRLKALSARITRILTHLGVSLDPGEPPRRPTTRGARHVGVALPGMRAPDATVEPLDVPETACVVAEGEVAVDPQRHVEDSTRQGTVGHHRRG